MFRILCPTRKSVILFNIVPKTLIVNSVRCKSSTVKLLRNPKIKNESNELYKWLLLVLPVTSFGLGCWQTYRLKWKLDLIQKLKESTNSPVVDLPKDFSVLPSLEYQPVKVKGHFIHDKEIFIGPRSLIEDSGVGRATIMSSAKTNQGFLLVTPFKLSENGETILINRGWIPKNLKPKTKREPSLVNEEVELVGIVRLPQAKEPFLPKNQPEKGVWYSRDIAALSAQLDTAPVWLDVKGIPDPPEGWPIPNQTRITLRNEHLSYLITWYSLSGITGFMWYRHFVKRMPIL